MVTMEDIAKAAGVSRGTVDRVLNNRGKVAPDKEILIRSLASSMGYRTNQAAKALAARQKNISIGFCYIEYPLAPFFHLIYENARKTGDEIQQMGISIKYFPISIKESVTKISDSTMLQLNKLDGIAADGVVAEKILEMSPDLASKIPFIVYNMNFDELENLELAYIGCDYHQAGRLACNLAALMTNENGKIAVITDDDGTAPSSKLRIEGFEQEIDKKYPKMKIVSKTFASPDMDQFDLFDRTKQVIEHHPDLDIIYLVNPGDYSICQAIRKASEKKDIPIITNDLISENSKEMVRNGKIAFTITQDPEVQGSLPLILLYRYLLFNEKPEKRWYKTKLNIYTSENID